MGVVGQAFVVACIAIVGLNWLANHLSKGKLIDARGVAVMLTMMCAAGNIQHVLFPAPRNLLINPVMDVLALMTMYVVSVNRPRVWKIVVGLCLLTELFIHAMYLPRLTEMDERSVFYAGIKQQYDTLLNILFALQLLFTAVPGGISLGRYCLSHLPRGWMSRHGLLAGAGR